MNYFIFPPPPLKTQNILNDLAPNFSRPSKTLEYSNSSLVLTSGDIEISLKTYAMIYHIMPFFPFSDL